MFCTLDYSDVPILLARILLITEYNMWIKAAGMPCTSSLQNETQKQNFNLDKESSEFRTAWGKSSFISRQEGKEAKNKKRPKCAASRWLMPEIISNLYYHNAAIGFTTAESLSLPRDKPPQICLLGWAPSPALRQDRPSKPFIGCVLHLNCQSVLLIKWISGFRVGGGGGGWRRRG